MKPHRIKLLGNGIDLRRFDPARLPRDTRRLVRASLGIAEDAPVVGFVGRLVAEKGVPELLRAARLVRERVPDTVFLLVGGSDEEKPGNLSPDAARAAGVADACVFTGVRHDLPELYRAMDVFALPSHREGFPRAAMEAAAMGLPCVVTDVRGCRQVVAQGENGLLVPARDESALAKALAELLLAPSLARLMGTEGRRRALRDFDERKVFATVLAEYERLLREKGLPVPTPVHVEPEVGAAAASDLGQSPVVADLGGGGWPPEGSRMSPLAMRRDRTRLQDRPRSCRRGAGAPPVCTPPGRPRSPGAAPHGPPRPLPPAPARSRRRRVRDLEAADHARRDPRPTPNASRPWGGGYGPPASTSCPSSSTCSAAR